MSLPNFIIAGTGRSGTTSLFRYLSDHPDICTSSKKETQFFIKYRENAADNLALYESYFSACDSDSKIILEATPHYLKWGKDIAHIIANVLPDVKLLFIFRNPVDLFFTTYRNLKNTDKGEISKLTFEQFTDIAINSANKTDKSGLSETEKSILFRLKAGCYSEYIQHYYNNFPSSNLYISFYDDLRKDIRKYLDGVLHFIGIQPEFYNNYNFIVENKTRAYKNSRLHHIANALNHILEPYLNRMHGVRRKLRTFYLYLNEGKNNKQASMPVEIEKKLTEYFSPYNKELYQLLKTNNPDLEFPSWLEMSEN